MHAQMTHYSNSPEQDWLFYVVVSLTCRLQNRYQAFEALYKALSAVQSAVQSMFKLKRRWVGKWFLSQVQALPGPERHIALPPSHTSSSNQV